MTLRFPPGLCLLRATIGINEVYLRPRGGLPYREMMYFVLSNMEAGNAAAASMVGRAIRQKSAWGAGPTMPPPSSSGAGVSMMVTSMAYSPSLAPALHAHLGEPMRLCLRGGRLRAFEVDGIVYRDEGDGALVMVFLLRGLLMLPLCGIGLFPLLIGLAILIGGRGIAHDTLALDRWIDSGDPDLFGGESSSSGGGTGSPYFPRSHSSRSGSDDKPGLFRRLFQGGTSWFGRSWLGRSRLGRPPFMEAA